MQRGFTLLELMIVVAVLAIIASIGVPQYVSALRIARSSKTRQELITIASAIEAFRSNHGGRLPLTLYQIGFGGRRDPWGTPYCYFNYTDGTGDGLDWAISVGLVDPSAVLKTGGSFGVGILPAVFGFGRGDLPLRPVAAAARRRSPQAPVAPLLDEGAGMTRRTFAQTLLSRLSHPPEFGAVDEMISTLPVTSVAVFTGVAVESVRRKDQYMWPLNTDYDLFSLGPNASTSVTLGTSLAQDDVIRANNGGYFGPASEY